MSSAKPLADLSSLRARIAAALRVEGFGGANTSVAICDLSVSRMLYARHDQESLLSASNEKLVTSSTALVNWGADFRFKTELLLSGTLSRNGVYKGVIFIKGFGDPSLSTSSYQRQVLHLKTARLSDFVTALKALGVKKIVGRVVGDDSYFDKARWVNSWKPGMTTYCGPISALSLNENMTVNGSQASDPPRYVAAEFTSLLGKAGISVSGAPAAWATPATAKLSYTELSAPLWRILAAMNKPSDNFFAEMLAKGLGASFGGGGTTARGVAVESALLVSQGISSATFRLADGSGLSYADRLTTLDIISLLRSMSKRADWPVFLNSLSVAGVDGTLARRMRNSAAQKNLHGKTGSSSLASVLSGYLTSADGQWLAFSIVMNNKGPINARAAHAAQDRIAVDLARCRPGGTVVWTPATWHG